MAAACGIGREVELLRVEWETLSRHGLPRVIYQRFLPKRRRRRRRTAPFSGTGFVDVERRPSNRAVRAAIARYIAVFASSTKPSSGHPNRDGDDVEASHGSMRFKKGRTEASVAQN